MSESNKNEKNYNEILNRLQKNISHNVAFFLIIKQYLSNVPAFYLASVIFRFISIISLSGNYYKFFTKTPDIDSSDIFTIQMFLENISSHKLLSIFNINQSTYILISFIIFLLFLLRISFYFNLSSKLKNLNSDSIKPVPNLYLKIVDHIVYLFFPFILEFLSFSYYIYFFPRTFVIKFNKGFAKTSFYIIILNTFLIIGYNINNYIFFICSNKENSVSNFEVSQTNHDSESDDRPFMYRYPKIVIYIIVALQNMCLLQTIDIYIGGNGKLYYKIFISILLLIVFIVLFFVTMHEYNYNTFTNKVISVLTIFCFYSIIIDLLFYLGGYVSKSVRNELIYVLLKLFVSYLTYLLIIESIYLKFLKTKIRQIIFNEKINKKETENNIINCFMYLNEIMINMKQKENEKSTSLLIKLINDHIKICHKTVCSCKLLSTNSNNEIEDTSKYSNIKLVEELSEYITNLLIVMDYLYESVFIEYDYYNNFNLTILLAEHYCYLKNNPTMSFSFIQTLILKQNKKLNNSQLVTVYELSQKYANYMKANFSNAINEDKVTIESINYKQRSEYFNQFLYLLKMSNNVKRLLIKYIDNEVMIVKYKNIFEDSIVYKLDENNENITSVKINFFDLVSKVEDEYENSNDINSSKKKNFFRNDIYNSEKNKNNLYSVLDLLKKEKDIYHKIIESIKNIDFLNMPICLIFKYFLFFDIFEGRKLSSDIIDKLYSSFCNNKTLYNSVISNKVYFLLMKKYIKQNNKYDSKYFAVWKYKKELRTKYFTESCLLRLGYKQADIINAKIDQLMPKEFAKSHQNMLKQYFIQYQRKYFSTEICCYMFDISGTVFYPIKIEGIISYEFFKNFVIIMEFSFKNEIEYRFMLDNNFDLLAHTKNFERDFYLNQTIFQSYNFKVMDIFQIKKSLLQKKFDNEYKNSLYQKKIRQGKIEEYLVPQFYVPTGEKTHDGFNSANFSGNKLDLFNKIFDNTDIEEIEDNEEYDKNNENQKLYNVKKSNKVYQDLFINDSKIIFHNNINILLYKTKFIQNLSKELTKIPENDLIFENNKKMYNLIIKSKARINEILIGFLNNNISKDEYLYINIKLSYYYDKFFYFISFIDKENNLKNFYLLKQPSNNLIPKNSPKKNINNKKQKQDNKLEDKKMTNNTNNNNQENGTEKSADLNNDNSGIVTFHETKKTENGSIKNSVRKNNMFTTISSIKDKEFFSSDNILNKINTYKKEINRDKFIFVIKWILSIICIFTFILYLIMLIMQSKTLSVAHKIFLAFFYNLHINEDILNTYHILISNYYEFMKFQSNSLLTYQDNIYIIQNLPPMLKDHYHNFTEFYNDFNLEIGNSFESLYKTRFIYKLRGYWKEVRYSIDYVSEMNLIVYNIYRISENITFNSDNIKDADNLLFRKGFKEKKEKVNSSYIKLLYYFLKNYDILADIIYDEMYNNIFDSCNNYLNGNSLFFYFLEILGLIFYLGFFVMILIYLYYSNNIIFKNIIFLFLDFSQNDINHNKTTDNNIIIYKLLELKSLLNDFDMHKLKNYAENISSYKGSIYIDNYSGIQNDSYSLNNKSPKLNDINKLNIINSQDIAKKENRPNFDLNFNNKQNNSRNILSNNNYRNILNKDISNMNQSSVEYLNLNKTNNQFLKDKLNSNHVSSSNNYSTKNVITHNRDHNNISQDKNIINFSQTSEATHDIILNKSNKNFIVSIKRYIIITIFLLAIIIAYDIIRFRYTLKLNVIYFGFFTDFKIIVNRYSILFYYFNVFRTLIIFPDDTVNNTNNILQSMYSEYEERNSKFDDLTNNNFKSYTNFHNLYELILKDSEKSNNNLNNKKELICQDNYVCKKYIDSNYSIFSSGVDFAYKSSMTEIGNMYLDFTKRTVNSEEEIKSLIQENKFLLTDLGMTCVFLTVKESIYSSLYADESEFAKKFHRSVTVLSLVTILFAIFIFLYFIAIIITISKYIEPIKDSVYRINCSFYYIKIYEIVNFSGLIHYAKKKSSVC